MTCVPQTGRALAPALAWAHFSRASPLPLHPRHLGRVLKNACFPAQVRGPVCHQEPRGQVHLDRWSRGSPAWRPRPPKPRKPTGQTEVCRDLQGPPTQCSRTPGASSAASRGRLLLSGCSPCLVASPGSASEGGRDDVRCGGGSPRPSCCTRPLPTLVWRPAGGL